MKKEDGYSGFFPLRSALILAGGIFLYACASTPEETPPQSPPEPLAAEAREPSPDEGWPMRLPPPAGEIVLAEPVPEAAPDISWERRSVPERSSAAVVLQEPPAPAAAETPPEPENIAALSGAEAPQAPLREEERSGAPPAGIPAVPPAVPVPQPPGGTPAEENPPRTRVPPAPVSPPADANPQLDFFPVGEAATIAAGPQRQISGAVGRTISVALPGTGWIYWEDEAAAGKIRYLGKVVEEGETVFSFTAFEKGDYTLRFQQQDLAANTLRYDDVRLAVEPPAETAADAGAARTPPEETFPAAVPAAPETAAAPEETDSQKMERLFREGKLKEAAAEAEKFVREHEADIQDLDEWYFALAEMFEKEASLRDMKKSLMYYEKVRDVFPLSRRWAASDARIRFIRLNFFDVR